MLMYKMVLLHMNYSPISHHNTFYGLHSWLSLSEYDWSSLFICNMMTAGWVMTNGDLFRPKTAHQHDDIFQTNFLPSVVFIRPHNRWNFGIVLRDFSMHSLESPASFELFINVNKCVEFGARCDEMCVNCEDEMKMRLMPPSEGGVWLEMDSCTVLDPCLNSNDAMKHDIITKSNLCVILWHVDIYWEIIEKWSNRLDSPKYNAIFSICFTLLSSVDSI